MPDGQKALYCFREKNVRFGNILNINGGMRMKEKKEQHKNTQTFHSLPLITITLVCVLLFVTMPIWAPLIAITVGCVLLFVTMPIWNPNTPGRITNLELYQMLRSDTRWAMGFQTGALLAMLALIASRL